LSAGLALVCAAEVRAQVAAGDSDAQIVRGIGTPSEEHKVSFEANSEGNNVIKEVVVKPGDWVKKGDILMTEDDAEARAQLAVAKAAAEAHGAADEAQVTIEAKTKIVEGLMKSIHSDREIVDAELERDTAIAKKLQADEDHKERQLQYELQQVKVDHMTLRSPIDGVVENVGLFAGEVVDGNSSKNGACYIVSIDPLWIELHLTAAQADQLKLHDKLDVAFPSDPNKWQPGEVIFLDPMVEYVGQTRTVRVSVPNPDEKPSGLPMLVRLPPLLGAGAAGAVGLAK